MNKQEYLKKLEEDKYKYIENQYTKGINDGLYRASLYAEELNEPEKPVLNKAEAKWLEELKKEQVKRTFCDEYDLLYFITRQGFGQGFVIDVANGEETPDETIELRGYGKDAKRRLSNALLYGYTVEDETRYTAKLKISGEYLRVTSDGSIGHYKVDRQYILDWATAYQFTESQLREYNIWEDDTYEIEEVKE